MKRLMAWLVAGTLAVGCGTPGLALAQDKGGVKEDIKDGAKGVAKGTKKVFKKTGKAIAKGTKKVVNKGAEKTREGATKIEEKTDKKK
jgi:hypothetical protein